MALVDVLSATDRAFLDLERRFAGMHVGAVVVLGPSDLVMGDGAPDLARIGTLVAAGLAAAPRFRQRVAAVPGLGAVWVDDPSFRLEAHLHRAALLRPGRDAELFELAGAIFSRPLPLGGPLWEMWLVEGMAGGRLAIVIKAHHALVDGVGGLGVLTAIVRFAAEDAHPKEPIWLAQPHGLPWVVRTLANARVRQFEELGAELRETVRGRAGFVRARDVAVGLVRTLRTGLTPASRTALNPARIGGERVFEGVRFDLARVNAVRSVLGGTVNDLVLAITAGGLRRALARMGDDVDHLRTFRALVPVDLRPRTGEAGIGNHIALLLAELPVGESDARARLTRIRENVDELKHGSHEIEGTAFLERVGDLAGPNLVSLTFTLAMRLRAFNVVVTNMAGPPVPAYLARSRVEAVYPLVPLFSHQALGVAWLGYDGWLHLGLHGDAAVLPSLSATAADFTAAFEELAAAASPVLH
jgi:diacylglycerol O-acyltransferase